MGLITKFDVQFSFVKAHSEGILEPNLKYSMTKPTIIICLATKSLRYTSCLN